MVSKGSLLTMPTIMTSSAWLEPHTHRPQVTRPMIATRHSSWKLLSTLPLVLKKRVSCLQAYLSRISTMPKQPAHILLAPSSPALGKHKAQITIGKIAWTSLCLPISCPCSRKLTDMFFQSSTCKVARGASLHATLPAKVYNPLHDELKILHTVLKSPCSYAKKTNRRTHSAT